MTAKAKTQEARKARLVRAATAVLTGSMKIKALEIVNGDSHSTYTVEWEDELGRWTCTCPDFVHRRGTCKHIYWAYLTIGPFMVNEMWPIFPREDAQAQAVQSQQPKAQPAPSQHADEDPAQWRFPSGKHAGKTLAQVWAEAPGYVKWCAFNLYAPGHWQDMAQAFLKQYHPEALSSTKEGKRGRGTKRTTHNSRFNNRTATRRVSTA